MRRKIFTIWIRSSYCRSFEQKFNYLRKVNKKRYLRNAPTIWRYSDSTLKTHQTKSIIRKIRHSPCQSWTDQLCIPNVNNISMSSMPSQNYQCTFFLHIEIHIFRPCDFRHSFTEQNKANKKKTRQKTVLRIVMSKNSTTNNIMKDLSNNVLFFCIELLWNVMNTATTTEK